MKVFFILCFIINMLVAVFYGLVGLFNQAIFAGILAILVFLFYLDLKIIGIEEKIEKK